MGIVELWTLYALAVSFTCLRTYARITAVGVRELQVDDYLVWIAILIYTAQCSLGYSLGVHVHGLANDGMTPKERAALTQDDPEYRLRVIGSKIQVAGWTTSACLLWSLKLCVAAFYLRLTAGLGMYTHRIYIAFASIIISFVIIIFTIYLSCRPFWHYWQISPDPGNSCQAAISKRLIWVTFVFNVSTDVYLLLIPIPMLWKSRLRTYKKIAAMLVLGAGMLVIVCAILKSIYLITDPLNSAELTASWGTRETFIAIFTTNLPMIFPLLKNWLAPFLPSTIGSSNAKGQEPPGSDFETIGGGSGPGGKRASRRAPHRAPHTFGGLTLDNESEEDMIKGDAVAMHPMQADSAKSDGKHVIVVSSEVSVTSEDHSGVQRKASFQIM
ncbi:uncharacterized protein J4E87_009857 [Alternaria ethzedia]|uniref:uncharacterized protein n=1 Tax=Alternaria ethzedia TaxID=181014 RepID=UPI0020C20B89|nr:uncharacterized protein J4E87_009857 [Alternaria ethzedia]KAI4613390.1 hypothetical protein J4E87_009857 [Alternaria ethzedia]